MFKLSCFSQDYISFSLILYLKLLLKWVTRVVLSYVIKLACSWNFAIYFIFDTYYFGYYTIHSSIFSLCNILNILWNSILKLVYWENICFNSLLLSNYFFKFSLNFFLILFLRNVDINNILYLDSIELKVK